MEIEKIKISHQDTCSSDVLYSLLAQLNALQNHR